MNGFNESIVCPSCKSIELASVFFGGFFNVYIHECSSCGHIIMESEWEPAATDARGDDQSIHEAIGGGVLEVEAARV
jgi:Zn ribbon nucleic-acid-binding protein